MRREEILASADRLFRHYGFSKTTVADIAKDCGHGVGSIYLEFPSKGEIARALAAALQEDILAEMKKAVAPDEPFSSRLVGLFEARAKAQERTGRRGTHAQELLEGPEGRSADVVALYREEQAALVEAFLRQGNEAGAFSVVEASATARLLLDCYDVASAASDPKGGERLATLHALILGGVLSRNHSS